MLDLGVFSSVDACSTSTRSVLPFLVDGDALILLQEQVAKEERSRRLLELATLLRQQPVLRSQNETTTGNARLEFLAEAKEAAARYLI